MKIDLEPEVVYRKDTRRYELDLVDSTGGYLTNICYLHADHKLTDGEVLELVSKGVLEAAERYLKFKESIDEESSS